MNPLMALKRQIDPPRMFLDGHELRGIVSSYLEHPYGRTLKEQYCIGLDLTLEVIPYELGGGWKGEQPADWMTFRSIQSAPGICALFLDDIELRGVRSAELSFIPNQYLPHIRLAMYVVFDPEDEK